MLNFLVVLRTEGSVPIDTGERHTTLADVNAEYIVQLKSANAKTALQTALNKFDDLSESDLIYIEIKQLDADDHET